MPQEDKDMAIVGKTVFQLQGVRDMTSLLDFLGNQEKYKAKMDQLSKEFKKIEDAISKYAKVRDIDREGKRARAAREEAFTRLESAKTEATDIRENARTQAVETKKAATRHASTVKDEP